MPQRPNVPPLEENFVYILEGSDDALSQGEHKLSQESDIVTVPTIRAGDTHLTHQDFQDDFVGSLSRLLRANDDKVTAAISSLEARFKTQLLDAEARHTEALTAERQKTEALAAELATLRDRERKLAFYVACLAADLGRLEPMITELDVEEVAVNKWWEKTLAVERAKLEKSRARTKAAMEAAAHERAEKKRLRQAAERERAEAELQQLMASFACFGRTNDAVRRCHLDFTLWFLMRWHPQIKARFVDRHATVGQVLLYAQSLGFDWTRVEWEVKFINESGYNEDARKRGIDVRRSFREVRDWAMQYLQENPGTVRTTAQMDRIALCYSMDQVLSAAKRKGVHLPDSGLENFYNWIWCAESYVATAKWLLQP